MRSHARRLATMLGALLVAAVLVAPAAAFAKPIATKVGGKVAAGAVEQGLDALDDPKSHARIGRVLASQPMQDATRALWSAAIVGIVQGVNEASALGLFPDGKRSGKAIGAIVDRDISPAVSRLVRKAVATAIETGLSAENLAVYEMMIERGIAAGVRGLATSARTDLGPAVAHAIENDVGPAIAKVIERDVMPAVARALEQPEVQAAIGQTLETITHHSVRGTEAGMSELKAEAERTGKESGLTLFGTRVAVGYAIAVFCAIAFAASFIVMLAMMVRSNRRHQELLADIRRREQFLADLLQSVDTEEVRSDLISRLRHEPPVDRAT